MIYDSVMRAGGEPFGAPFANGLLSLTDRIVKLFKLKGFFGFETFERLRRGRRKNRFSRYGSANHLGRLDLARARAAQRAAEKKKGRRT